jgi:hypothetical protein
MEKPPLGIRKESRYTDHDYLSGENWRLHDAALDLPEHSEERQRTLKLLTQIRDSCWASHCAQRY